MGVERPSRVGAGRPGRPRAGGAEPAGGPLLDDAAPVVRRLLYLLALGAVAFIAFVQLRIHDQTEHLFDFYPLYHGARALIETGDAYALDPSLMDIGGVTAVGNSYPMHAVIVFGVPLSWMAPAVAAVAWTAGMGLAWVLAVWWANESPYWFLWTPMYLALLIQQPSAAIGVAAIVAIGALRRGTGWPLALALVVLTMKPQQTLLLALVFAWWGRRWWRPMLVSFGVVSIVGFLAQPGWIGAWLTRVDLRSELVPDVWVAPILLPLAVLLIFRGWRESGLAIASSAIVPWPEVAGYYSASAWPIGTQRSQAAATAVVGLVALLAIGIGAPAWLFLVIMCVGLGGASILLPQVRLSLREFAPEGSTSESTPAVAASGR